MAITLSTTLAAACTASDQKVLVTSATSAAVGMIAKMEQEYALITAIDSTTLTLSRLGLYGSSVQAHKILSPIEISAAADFPGTPTGSPIPIPYGAPELTTYGAAGAIAIPNENADIFINKATAAAMTLVAPSTAQDGVTLCITAGTAAAHTVTTPTATGFKNTTGTATFGGAIGDSMTIKAYKGLWLPVATVNVTFA